MQKERPLVFPEAPKHEPEAIKQKPIVVQEEAKQKLYFNDEGLEHTEEDPKVINVVVWNKEKTTTDSYVKIKNLKCIFCKERIKENEGSLLRYECLHASCLGCAFSGKRTLKKCPSCTIDFTKNRPLDVGSDPNYSEFLKTKIGGSGLVKIQMAPKIPKEKLLALNLVPNKKISNFLTLKITIPQMHDHLNISDLNEYGFNFDHLLIPSFISDATYLPKFGIKKSAIRKMYSNSKQSKRLANLLCSNGYTAKELSSLGWTYSGLISDGMDKINALTLIKNSNTTLGKFLSQMKTETLLPLKISEKHLQQFDIPIDIKLV